jgi:CheY-like chemotaxis protein
MAANLSGLRVLLVEDEEMTSYYQTLLLTKAGCDVVGPVATLQEAMAQAETEHFDAVLLDVNLNGESSYPVADALLRRELPFVFMTAYGRSQIPEQYRWYPCCQKSAGPDHLLDTLSRAILSRRAKQEIQASEDDPGKTVPSR